jgi:hypothetical protein
MKLLATFFTLTLSLSVFSQVYKAPNLKLKVKAKSFEIKKEEKFDSFKVHQYKINSKPERKRNIASQKRGGRIPSSKTIDYHQTKVSPWPFITIK